MKNMYVGMYVCLENLKNIKNNDDSSNICKKAISTDSRRTSAGANGRCSSALWLYVFVTVSVGRRRQSPTMAAVLTILTTSLHQIHATKMHKRLHRCCFNSSGNISGKAVSKALQQSSTALMCADVHTMPAEARRETSIGKCLHTSPHTHTHTYMYKRGDCKNEQMKSIK